MAGDQDRLEAQFDRSDRFLDRSVYPPETLGHVRSDDGQEFIAKAVRIWSDAVGAKSAFIEPDTPWENGYCESFNSKLRVKLLNGEMHHLQAEARVIDEA